MCAVLSLPSSSLPTWGKFLLLATLFSLQIHSAFAQEDHDHEGEEEHHDEENEQLVRNLKGMSIAVIFTLSMIVNLFIIFLSPKLSPFFQRLAAAFAGGVIFVVGLCHVAAEANDILLAHHSEAIVEQYRPSYIVGVAGCMLMLFLQRGIHKDAHQHSHDEEGETRATPANSPVDGPDTTAMLVVASEGSSSQDEVRPVAEQEQPAATPNPQTAPKEDHSHHSHQHHPSLLSRILLLVTFIVHTVIEGMALGLQSTRSGVILLFVGVAVHHWAEDLTFALSHKTYATWKRLVMSTIQAAACPVGIAIGWGVGNSASPYVVGYLLSISSGTFLFLALVEVVSEVMPPHERNTAACSAFFLGIGLTYMLLVLVYDKDAHAH